jgi:hypothetical protein
VQLFYFSKYSYFTCRKELAMIETDDNKVLIATRKKLTLEEQFIIIWLLIFLYGLYGGLQPDILQALQVIPDRFG